MCVCVCVCVCVCCIHRNSARPPPRAGRHVVGLCIYYETDQFATEGEIGSKFEFLPHRLSKKPYRKSDIVDAIEWRMDMCILIFLK